MKEEKIDKVKVNLKIEMWYLGKILSNFLFYL